MTKCIKCGRSTGGNIPVELTCNKCRIRAIDALKAFQVWEITHIYEKEASEESRLDAPNRLEGSFPRMYDSNKIYE